MAAPLRLWIFSETDAYLKNMKLEGINMSDSVLHYEEKMWELFDVTKDQMPILPKLGSRMEVGLLAGRESGSI